MGLGLTPSGGWNVGGGVTGGGELHLSPTEHRGEIYCKQAHYGPVSCGKAEARTKNGNAAVGTGGYGFEWDTGGGPQGGADRGGRGDGRDGDCNRRLVK